MQRARAADVGSGGGEEEEEEMSFGVNLRPLITALQVYLIHWKIAMKLTHLLGP